MKGNQDVSSRKLIDHLVPDRRWGVMQGLLATTYELQPDFLEMDFLPSAFGLAAWDHRSWASRIALEKRLFDLDGAIIFTEARRYRGRPRSLRLEVRPISSFAHPTLHAKVTLLVFERAVRLIVGSANLTELGYRRNREVVAVLTAFQDSKREAALIAQALVGMDAALAPWLTQQAQRIIRRSLEILKGLTITSGDFSDTFLWTFGQTKLWREFIKRWPAGESIKRISILSPFWSEDAKLTLISFLTEIKKACAVTKDLEIRLLTDAFEGQDGRLIPILPPAYAAYDWASLGVKATAQAVSPKVLPEELGGMEGFTGVRSLHAKVVLFEGTKNALAYLGSANFTAHGWGFLQGKTAANIEAGIVVRRLLSSTSIDCLLPEVMGAPVLLSSDSVRALKAPEKGPGDILWPEFIREVLLVPVAKSDNELALEVEVEKDSASHLWSAKLPNKDGNAGETLISKEETLDKTRTSFSVSISPQVLTRLLTEQEILICWKECIDGRLVPLNVESSARFRLPISPNTQRIEEADLLSYYQGRIAWEQLFPDPLFVASEGDQAGRQVVTDAGVDKSKIQSYQIREFVEALPGLRKDLKDSAQSEPSMRLSLLGPVSPVALARTVLESVEAKRRTPTAAAFQLVEILACMRSVYSFEVPEKLTAAWHQYLDEALDKTTRLLEQLLSEHADTLAPDSAFSRYKKTVLSSSSRLEL